MDIKHISKDWGNFKDYLHKKINGVKTGFPILDSQIMGLPGITGVLGEPGSYKSTFCLQVAAYHAENYGPVLYYDAENGLNRIRFRLICQLLNVCPQMLVSSSDDVLVRASNILEDFPLYVMTNIDFYNLESFVEEVISKTGAKRVMLVIDSLQTLPNLHENKRYSMSMWMFALNDLKKKYDNVLTILAPIEKKRGTYETSGMDSGKESGDIEYKAEVLLDIQRSKKESDNYLTVTCIKDRDGPSGVKFLLRPVLSDPEVPTSFTYKLQETEIVDL